MMYEMHNYDVQTYYTQTYDAQGRRDMTHINDAQMGYYASCHTGFLRYLYVIVHVFDNFSIFAIYKTYRLDMNKNWLVKVLGLFQKSVNYDPVFSLAGAAGPFPYNLFIYFEMQYHRYF